jgi:23S rRNA pseudouridine955/2504/2580 synthase
MFLHARQVTFAHPVSGERVKIASPLPVDLASFLVALGANAR